MATEGTAAETGTQKLLDERLDLLDRALIGLLPRSRRLELVGLVESQVRELLATGGSTAVEEALRAAPADGSRLETSGAFGTLPESRLQRRSRMAFSAGIIGLVSIGLLVCLPIAYLGLTIVADAAGEWISSAIMVVMLAAAASTGTLAVTFGIAGLLKTVRRQSKLTGAGWAVTGLCTGPLPALVGGIPLLLIGLSLLFVHNVAVSMTVPPPATSYVSAPCTACESPMAVVANPSAIPPNAWTTPPTLPYAPPPLPMPMTPAVAPYPVAPTQCATAPTGVPLAPVVAPTVSPVAPSCDVELVVKPRAAARPSSVSEAQDKPATAADGQANPAPPLPEEPRENIDPPSMEAEPAASGSSSSTTEE
jgi:hypothetical protein